MVNKSENSIFYRDVFFFFVTCILFTSVFAFHIFGKPEYVFLNMLPLTKYILDPLYLFMYTGAWISVCIVILYSMLISLKRYWLFNIALLLAISSIADCLVAFSAFEVVTTSRIIAGFATYFIIFSFSMPFSAAIYYHRNKKKYRR